MYQNIALIGINDQLIIFVVLALLLFGGKKIPELMRGLGKGLGEFQKGLDEGKQEMAKASLRYKENTHLNIENETTPKVENIVKDSHTNVL